MQQQRGVIEYKNGFQLKIIEKRINNPYSWRSPRLVFVNSMSDLFHEKIPLSYLEKIFIVMNSTPRHTYQILTKRIDNLLEMQSSFQWSKNIWLGVSVENNKCLRRIDLLKNTNAKTKF